MAAQSKRKAAPQVLLSAMGSPGNTTWSCHNLNSLETRRAGEKVPQPDPEHIRNN